MTKKRYYPEKINMVTSADEAGMILDIDRITGESLFDYKKRLLESSSKVANSGYNGLINGINRELGLEQKEAIKVSLRDILTGDLNDDSIVKTDYKISDNRSYQGVLDGNQKFIHGKKVKLSGSAWKKNYLAGLTFTVSQQKFKIISNTNNEITLDREPESNYLGQSYIIKPEWKVNSFIGYRFKLESEDYTVLSNTSNTLTLNKVIKYRTNGYFSLALTRPRVQVTSSRIIFYIEYLNNENFRVDLEVDLRENNLDTKKLCDIVNKESRFFILQDLTAEEEPLKAFTFRKKDSDVKVFKEKVPASKFFKLENKNIKPNTLKFSESDIFSKEEEELNETLFGPFYSVNHIEGIIESSMLPSGNGEVSYTYMDFPMVIESAPVVVVSLSDKESEKFLFSQKEKIIYEDSRDRFVSSQPKTEMIEYISELLRVNRQSWGE